MKLSRILLTALVLAVIASPMAGAQTNTPVASCSKECDPKDPALNPDIPKKTGDKVFVILYGHFEDILNQAPLNTQNLDKEGDLNRGFLMPVIDTNHKQGCSVNTCLDFHFKNNEFTMFSSPGLVEYLNDGWRTHQEPGLAADAVIAGTSFNLYWYLSAHAVPNENSGSQNGGTAKVGVMPQVGVYARMETGRHKFKGTEIAVSDDAAANAPGSANRVNMITTPNAVGDKDVYEFQVRMIVRRNIIPSAETENGFVVYVNPYQIKEQAEAQGQGGVQLAQADWRLRTGPKFPPRLVIPIENPMETRSATLTIFEQRLFVRWSFLSAFGSYDMQDATKSIKSTGPNKVEDKAIDDIILKRSIDHDGHFKPVNQTWAIDYGMQNPDLRMADGDYQLTASILNLQGTFMLEQKFDFKVAGGVPQVPIIGNNRAGAGAGAQGGGLKSAGEAPGFDAVILVAAVAGLVALGLRRRPE